MPHVSDVRSTSHDRHDPMLVVALAADDLAGAERDQAVALTSSCTECATLHDDLLALARATAAAPPPVATRPRDFRLTPADAARLRPSGWRRLVGALSTSRSAVTRPLGVGLATLGLAGLLIGNVSFSLGGSAASAPLGASSAGASVGAGSESTTNRGAAADFGSKSASSAPSSGLTVAGAPAASAAAASAAPAYAPGSQDGAPSGLPGSQSAALAPIPAASAGTDGAGGQIATDVSGTRSPASEPFRPQNLLFGLAIVVGLGLLVASGRRRGRSV